MASLLSPFAPPFIPGREEETPQNNQNNGVPPANVRLPLNPHMAPFPAPIASEGSSPEAWMWQADVYHQPGISPVPGSIYSPVPYMTPFSMPVIHSNPVSPSPWVQNPYSSYMYSGAIQSGVKPLMIPNDQRFLNNPGRRRRKKWGGGTGDGGSGGKKAQQPTGDANLKKEPERPKVVHKILTDNTAQTDFPQEIRERLLDSSAFQHPIERTRIETSPCHIPNLRTIAVWTSNDLLKKTSPPPPQQTRPVFSYAAALKAPRPPPAVVEKVAERPISGRVRQDQPRPDEINEKVAEEKQEERTKQKEKPRQNRLPGQVADKPKKKKKKAKAPVVDLEAVKAEEEANRAASLQTFSTKFQVKTEDLDEYPDLTPETRNNPRAPVWVREGPAPRGPGILHVGKAIHNTTWRGGGPKSLLEAATVKRVGQREVEEESRDLQTLPAKERTVPGAEKQILENEEAAAKPMKISPQQQQQREKAPTGRPKFKPLFSVGGSSAGSAQTILFRPKELPVVAPPPKNFDFDLQSWANVKTMNYASANKPRRSTDIKFAKGINPLDSGITVKRGKEREKPKPKKPTPMKQIILRERQLKKNNRLRVLTKDDVAEDPGAISCPETGNLTSGETEAEGDDKAASAPEDGGEEENREGVENWESLFVEGKNETPSTPGLHSRRFRDYCDQIIGNSVNECVLAILADLVRFQDRLHLRDPIKARQKRRLVYGIKEVTKHLKMNKIRLVIISPDVEKIESKGGLDEAIHNILDLCTQQSITHVFSLPRKMLGQACKKSVPVSVVGVFNYDGTEKNVRRLEELVEEGRRQYRLVSKIMDSERGENEAHETSHPIWKLKHSRNASNVSEPISDLAGGGHSRQSSVGGQIGLVMRQVTKPSGGEYEADDEDDGV